MKFKSIDDTEKTSLKEKNKVCTVFKRIGITFVIVLVGFVGMAYGVIGIMCKGPSSAATDIFVTTCMETSFAKYFPPMFLSKAEIDKIMARNSVIVNSDVTKVNNDFSNIKDEIKDDEKDIEIVPVVGSTYKGKMMIVKDPSRVYIGTLPSYGKDVSGMRLKDMIEHDNAIAGTNAGGFADEGGVGNGGIPLGVVIHEGKLKYGSPDTSTVLLGFDDKNVFHVGMMTAKEALEKNIREAVSFGPPLIVNGKPAQINGNGGGLNPRTALGQREDGAVLMLVIDGRQPHSLGANYKDLIDVMQEFGAINAGNLDGGSSSLMYYNGEVLSTCSSLYGPRKMPTSILVKRVEE